MPSPTNRIILPYSSGTEFDPEAGADEAGRGCLAGPVVAAAVILPPGFVLPGLTDSKRITERRRYELREIIKREALAWAVAESSPQEIDFLNILRASLLAMSRAINSLSLTPKAAIVDGNKIPSGVVCHTRCLVKGDAILANIAAASILAKTTRDDIMNRLATLYPEYAWDINKGYPTEAHRQAIALHGPTPYHRRSFRLLPEPSLF
ncbi:MAG: ribonuclease HII [Pseudoflavonifractor sp.]|nr:ribonuclease HII [Alloprevotella sp.]MCM1117494.1 ribonuclease HII [Pseudoflavonifractor sp.]